MTDFATLYAAHAFWLWMGLGAVILAVEAAVGTEVLLWPAAAAAVVGLLTLLVRFDPLVEVAIFAGLTLVAALASRSLTRRMQPSDVDINDRDARLVGQRAKVVEAFSGGQGRVFVSGAEWAAEIDGAAPEVGENVVVDAVLGARLRVRSA